MPIRKLLLNEFSFQIARFGHFSNQCIIHGEKIANMGLICKQFENIMFMLLFLVVTTLSNFQESLFADFS